MTTATIDRSAPPAPPEQTADVKPAEAGTGWYDPDAASFPEAHAVLIAIEATAVGADTKGEGFRDRS